MGRRLVGLRQLWLIAALAAALALGGCSGNSPLAPDNGQNVTLTKSLAPASDPSTVCEASQLIAADDGGTIAISRNGYDHAFVVEKDALDKDELISVKVSDDFVKGHKAVVFEFGPDGLVFKEASKLVFDINDLNSAAQSANLYYYDPRAGDWVLQKASAVDKGLVIFDIYHFSKYAISD